MSDALFALPTDAYAMTSDDCYTPRWVFDAMGLQFDLDVAAPKGGPWHVPAARYYTAEDDDGTTLKFGWTPICVAFRGVGTEPAERLAAADKFGAVLYGRNAA